MCKYYRVYLCAFITVLHYFHFSDMDYSLIVSITANIITFSVGAAMTWTSPVLEKLSSETSDNHFVNIITEEEVSWISASFSLGAIIGPFIYGILMDRIGRKWTLLTAGIPYFIGHLTMASSKSIYIVYFARLICGLSGGGVFNVIPVYIAEISEPSKRGMLSSLMNIFLCTGELFSYCVGPFVSLNTFNIILAIFPVIFLISFFFIAPESAYFYLSKDNFHMARKSLEKLRKSNAGIEEELENIHKSIKDTESGTIMDIFASNELKKALLICLGLMFFQQSSGIIAIIFYAQTIFKEAGVDLNPIICAIIIGGIQLGVGFITPFTIDKFGRRTLLLFSAIGTLISEGTLGIFSFIKTNKTYDLSSMSVLPFVCLIVYILTYNIGCGPLPWVIMGELFPSNVKSAASLFSTFFSFTLSFLVVKYFQTIVVALGIGGSFLIFASSCLMSIPFCYFCVIETKGKTLLKIKEDLGS